jgi:hypothetical protein
MKKTSESRRHSNDLFANTIGARSTFLVMVTVLAIVASSCATVKPSQPIVGIPCPAGTTPNYQQKAKAESLVRVGADPSPIPDPNCPGTCFWLTRFVGQVSKIRVEIRAKAEADTFFWCEPLHETIARQCPNLNPARQKVCSDGGKIRCIDTSTPCWTPDKGQQDATPLHPAPPAQNPPNPKQPEPKPAAIVSPAPQKSPRPGCVKFTLLQSQVAPPSKISLSFRLTDCDGRPVLNATIDDFAITEGYSVLSVSEGRRSLETTPGVFPRSTVLLLDLSGSIWNTGNLPGLQKAAAGFVRQAAVPGHNIAIFAFDGSNDITKIVDFTDDAKTLQSGVDSLARYSSRDDATNLNGAVIKGLDVLEQRRDSQFGGQAASFVGSLAVFTDGKDTAGRTADQDAINRVQHSGFAVFAIGLGPEVNRSFLQNIGKNGSFPVQGQSYEIPELADAFRKIAADIISLSSGRYSFTYCSPKRAGSHKVNLTFADAKGSLSYGFNAARFDGLCDPKTGAQPAHPNRDTWVEVPVGKDPAGKGKAIGIMARRVSTAQFHFHKTGEWSRTDAEAQSTQSDAEAYCASIGARLMTTDEFKAAAKAGRKTEGVGGCGWPNALGVHDLGKSAGDYYTEWAKQDRLFVKDGNPCSESLSQLGVGYYGGDPRKAFRCARD